MYTTSNICSEFCVNTHQILSQLSPTFQPIFLEKKFPSLREIHRIHVSKINRQIKSNKQETHIYTNCVFWSTSFTNYLIKIRYDKRFYFSIIKFIFQILFTRVFFRYNYRYKTNRKFIIIIKLMKIDKTIKIFNKKELKEVISKLY